MATAIRKGSLRDVSEVKAAHSRAKTHSPYVTATYPEPECNCGTATTELRKEWSVDWCKPRPGMVQAAMKATGVSNPGETLMIGADYIDLETAFNAKVNYMPFQYLVQCTPNSSSYWHCFHPKHSLDHFVPAGAQELVASLTPSSFAARKGHEKRTKRSQIAPNKLFDD